MVEAAPAARFKPDEVWEREKVIRVSNELNDRTSCKAVQREDVFRLHALRMDWDIGLQIHEPSDGHINSGADGKKVGVFLLQDGAGDFKCMERLATLFVEKFRYKVVVMTFPGMLYLDDKSRDWPGDTMNAEGIVRTPFWLKGEHVASDQYELVRDASKRTKYGVRTHARAKPGTRFYDRMASWPVAFEKGMKEACRSQFPESEYLIYVQGHSTGGPYVSMLTQRVPNIAGVLAIENSTFGYVNERKHQWGGHVGKIEGYEAVATKTEESWKDPFYDLYIRTWRDLARYRGPEALGQEGPNALMRLPWLMEEILDAWDIARKRPQFKAEYMITHNIVGALESAARVVARRLNMSAADEQKLVDHYIGYTKELSGPGVKPVPPYLFVIAKDSRDHNPEVYRDVILPMFAQMNPAPRTHVTRFLAGVHTYTKPEQDLPMGIAPAAAHYFNEAIMGGYFVL